jgi:hypothetical protein
MTDETLYLKSFLEKYRIAKSANSKEIRLTLQEAEQLSSAISMSIANQLLQANQIIDLQQQILSAEVKQDGGKF